MTQNYELKNYMLDLVNLMLPRFFRDNAEKYGDIISNNDIQLEIKAMALNMLPPMYITTKIGAVYGEYNMREMQKQADVSMAFSKACDAVIALHHKS